MMKEKIPSAVAAEDHYQDDIGGGIAACATRWGRIKSTSASNNHGWQGFTGGQQTTRTAEAADTLHVSTAAHNGSHHNFRVESGVDSPDISSAE
jgi:hypothetical protein